MRTVSRHVTRYTVRQLQRIGAAVALFAALSATGCPHTVRPTGSEVADCAKESGKDIFFTLLPRVSTIIATGPDLGSITIELAKLVAEYGVDTVTCAVEAVRGRNQQAAAVASGDEKALHERSDSLATQWLVKHGAQIKQ